MKLYIAGASSQREPHKALHKDMANRFNVTSDWPFLPEILSPTEEHSVWAGIDQLICECDTLMVATFGPAPLRGALVEVGMALAYHKPVLLVGNHGSYGHWRYHPGVETVPTIGAAVTWLQDRGF